MIINDLIFTKISKKLNNILISLIQIDTLQKAKELPCAFNNFAVFYKGKFEKDILLGITYLKK